MSIGIFLAGESEGRSGIDSLKATSPRNCCQNRDGDKPSARIQRGFFPWQDNSWLFISVGAQFQRSLGSGMVSDTNGAALRHLHGESRFIFLGILRRQPHSKQELRKENLLARDKLQLLLGSSEGCAISCLCLQHSRNSLKDKCHIFHNSVLYWESTRQRNGVRRNWNFTEILQEMSMLWQWYPHVESKRFPENLGVLRRNSMSGYGMHGFC